MGQGLVTVWNESMMMRKGVIAPKGSVDSLEALVKLLRPVEAV